MTDKLDAWLEENSIYWRNRLSRLSGKRLDELPTDRKEVRRQVLAHLKDIKS